MTAATDEGWIEGSIARLETLEAQREQLAASGQTAALAEIDEEIRALYEVLESVAGEDQEPQAPANTAMAPPVMQAAPAMGMGMGMAPAPMHAAPPMGMGMAPAPMHAAPPMGMGGDMGMAPPPTFDMADDDIKPPRGPLPFILIGLLVAGGGAGAFMVLGKNEPQEAKPGPTEPATIIQAGDIAEDTQEPNVAKGGDADRTRGTHFKERPEDRSTAPRRTSGSSSSRPSSSSKKKSNDGRKIKVVDSNDPLAGID